MTYVTTSEDWNLQQANYHR